MIREWHYPKIGIVIGACPSAGHDVVTLDYRECGADGEPSVVHVETETTAQQSTFLAKDFQSFIDGLVEAHAFEN